MAITFDHSITTDISAIDGYDRINILTFDGITYTNRYKLKESTFDYFRDNAGVGDIIYFSWFGPMWHDLKLNIDTPLVADAITIVWEYKSYLSSVWQPLNCIDNSNGFQNSGSQTIEFIAPADWQYMRIYPSKALYLYGSFIRARITEVTNLTEGGANGTVAPDGKDGTLQITGSETLTSIYNSGLGIVVKSGMTYVFHCNFRIGDKVSTPTTFTMRKETLHVGDSGSAYRQKHFLFAQNVSDIWNMGSPTGDGCAFLYHTPASSNTPYNYFRCVLNWYNSLIQKEYGGYGQGGMSGGMKIFENCIFSPYNVFFLVTCAVGSYFKNTIVDIGTTGYWHIYTNRFSFDNIQITKGLGILAQGCTLSNTVFGSKLLNCYSGHNYLIDCQIDNPDQQLMNSSVNRADYGHVQYTLNIDIVDKLGLDIIANIEVKSSSGDIVYDGESSIPTIIDVFSRYWPDGAGSTPVTTNSNPFTITVSKSGYDDYVLNNFKLLRKTELILTLLEITPIVYKDRSINSKLQLEEKLIAEVSSDEITAEMNQSIKLSAEIEFETNLNTKL